jgi:hypothetical protein
MSAAGQTKPTSGPTFTLIIALVTVIGGLWSLDVFLARTERQSVQSEANGLYRQGALLLQQ